MSCQKLITSIINGSMSDNDIGTIHHGQPFQININFNRSQLFKFEIDRYSDVDFKLLTTTPQSSMSITIYNKDGTKNSSSNIVTPVANISTKLDRGWYYICFETKNIPDTKSTVTMNIGGHDETFIFTSTLPYGVNFGYNLYIKPRPPIPIDGDIIFELIDGSLPDGIIMDEDGRVHGNAPEMDCLHDNVNYSPSNNWSYDDGSVLFSWGRQWRFKIRGTLLKEGSEAEPIEEWFCVKIFNNWNFDRDDFIATELDNYNIQTRVIEHIVDDIKDLDKGLCIQKCEPEYVEPFIPTPIMKDDCETCSDSSLPITDVFIEVILIPPSILSKIEDIFNTYTDIKTIHNQLLALPKPDVDSYKFVENVKASSIFDMYYNDTLNQFDIRLHGSSIELFKMDIDYEKLLADTPVEYEYLQNKLDALEYDVIQNDPYIKNFHFGSTLEYHFRGLEN